MYIHTCMHKAEEHTRVRHELFSTAQCLMCIWICILSRSAWKDGNSDLNPNYSFYGNSLVVQWLELGAFTARAWDQSLVGELRSRKPRGVACINKFKNIIKQTNKPKNPELFTLQISNMGPRQAYTTMLQEYILSNVNNNQGKHIKCYIKQCSEHLTTLH